MTECTSKDCCKDTDNKNGCCKDNRGKTNSNGSISAYKAQTDRISMLFLVVQREIDSDRNGVIYEMSKGALESELKILTPID